MSQLDEIRKKRLKYMKELLERDDQREREGLK